MKRRTKFDRYRVRIVSDKPSMTCQEFKDECDINKIVTKMSQGLDITPSSVRNGERRKPVFGDFTNIGDYQDMRNKVNDARDKFDALPSQVRSYFGYDPASLLDAVNDPSRKEELVRLGIFVPQKDKPVENTVQVVNDQTDKEKGASI